MNNTKLAEIFRTFTKDEWKQFVKFAASPFFNNGRNYTSILKLLQKHHPAFESDKLTYEYIYGKLYPGKEFNKQVMWNFVSELEKLAKEFLLHSALKESKTDKFKLTFDQLLKRRLDNLSLKEIEDIEKQVELSKLGPDYFDTKRIIEDNKAEYWTTIKGRQEKGFDNIIKGAEYSIINFLIYISGQIWDIHIFKRMYNAVDEKMISYEFVKSFDFKRFIDAAMEREYEYAPIIKFYYNKIMCALDEDNEEHFFEMKKYFEEHSDQFDILEQKNILITLANYCANKMRLGEDIYLKTLFEINKFRLQKKTDTLVNGRINKALYHQMLRSALAVNEVEWAENFIKEYTPMLNVEYQKTMHALASGFIHYVRKDYNKVLQNLNKVEFIDIRDKLHVRILSAKAYYELDKTELLLDFIDSSKHFVNSNTSIENATRESYMKFFYYLHKLVLLKEKPVKAEFKKIKTDISSDEILRLRHGEWFLEKLGELKN